MIDIVKTNFAAIKEDGIEASFKCNQHVFTRMELMFALK